MLDQYRQDKVKTEAARIYQQSQAAAEQCRKMGMTVRGVMAMSLEEIEGQLTFLAEQEREYHINLYAGRWLERSRDEVMQYCQGQRRRNGVKALKNKYGHNLAQKIVREKSGRPITLR